MNNKQDFKFENDIDVYSSLEAQIIDRRERGSM